MGGSGEVKSHSSSFERQKHDGGAVFLGALELPNDFSPPLLIDGAIQAHKTETVLAGEEKGGYQC